MTDSSEDRLDNAPAARLLFLHCQTALHAGAGSVLSHIDLPIQREAHSAHPIVYASGMKGSLREAFEYSLNEKPSPQWLRAFFGSEPGTGTTSAGSAIFQEARVLLFPVRCFKGTFAWVTCEQVWRRFVEAVEDVNLSLPSWIPDLFLTTETSLFPSDLAIGSRLYLEDYDFEAPTGAEQFQVAFQEFREQVALLTAPSLPANSYLAGLLKRRVCLVADDMFTALVRYHTQIETHVQIGTNGTVQAGPWTQESLPPMTVLYTVVRVPRLLENGAREALLTPSNAMDVMTNGLSSLKILYVGGDRTLGKGAIRVKIPPSNGGQL